MDKKFISFSGGVESTTMCLLYGKGAKAIFCDTGWEHKEMYKRIDYVETLLKEYHEGDFEVIRIKPEVKVGDEKIHKLQDYIEKTKYFPNQLARFCTRIFKIEPIDRFLSSQGECELMIGLNYEEKDKRKGNHEKLKTVNYTYPLVEDELDRDDCIKLLEKYGLEPNFPPYMSRGGCVGCFFKGKKEYRAMVHLSREEIESVSELEKKVQDKRGKFYRIKRDMPSIEEFISIEENTLFNQKDFYLAEKDHYSCGMFCHR
jgi:3'-phosphoadenosine 5'-phosphosulfate sulfotransferase (PAPS reductase)/FAD synthetase